MSEKYLLIYIQDSFNVCRQKHEEVQKVAFMKFVKSWEL